MELVQQRKLWIGNSRSFQHAKNWPRSSSRLGLYRGYKEVVGNEEDGSETVCRRTRGNEEVRRASPVVEDKTSRRQVVENVERRTKEVRERGPGLSLNGTDPHSCSVKEQVAGSGKKEGYQGRDKVQFRVG